MQTESLMVAVAQPLCVPGDAEGNLDRMEPMIRAAAGAGAELVLFAEAGVTGYEARPRTLERLVRLGDATCARLHEMAARHGIVVAAGFLETNERKTHVSHGVFHPDGRFALQRKHAIANVERLLPAYAPAPPLERTFFEVHGVKCAISICADFKQEGLMERLVAAGVQLHFLPTAGGGSRQFGFSQEELRDPVVLEKYLEKEESVFYSRDVVRSVCRYRMAMATCNQMADDGRDYFHPGHSMVIDSTGEMIAMIPGAFVFEHLRQRVVWGLVHPAQR